MVMPIIRMGLGWVVGSTWNFLGTLIMAWTAVCPGSSYAFYIVTYYIKWVTSWTHGTSTSVYLSSELSTPKNPAISQAMESCHWIAYFLNSPSVEASSTARNPEQDLWLRQCSAHLLPHVNAVWLSYEIRYRSTQNGNAQCDVRSYLSNSFFIYLETQLSRFSESLRRSLRRFARKV